MTTAEKEKRISDLGSPWSDIMRGLAVHRERTMEEKGMEKGISEAVGLSREHYYAKALSVIIDCAGRKER